MDARTVPLSAVPQLAGAAPERMRRMGAVPMAVSMASSHALRAVVENWKAMWLPHRMMMIQRATPAAMAGMIHQPLFT
jgi:hypothetical protein